MGKNSIFKENLQYHQQKGSRAEGNNSNERSLAHQNDLVPRHELELKKTDREISEPFSKYLPMELASIQWLMIMLCCDDFGTEAEIGGDYIQIIGNDKNKNAQIKWHCTKNSKNVKTAQDTNSHADFPAVLAGNMLRGKKSGNKLCITHARKDDSGADQRSHNCAAVTHTDDQHHFNDFQSQNAHVNCEAEYLQILLAPPTILLLKVLEDYRSTVSNHTYVTLALVKQCDINEYNLCTTNCSTFTLNSVLINHDVLQLDLDTLFTCDALQSSSNNNLLSDKGNPKELKQYRFLIDRCQGDEKPYKICKEFRHDERHLETMHSFTNQYVSIPNCEEKHLKGVIFVPAFIIDGKNCTGTHVTTLEQRIVNPGCGSMQTPNLYDTCTEVPTRSLRHCSGQKILNIKGNFRAAHSCGKGCCKHIQRFNKMLCKITSTFKTLMISESSYLKTLNLGDIRTCFEVAQAFPRREKTIGLDYLQAVTECLHILETLDSGNVHKRVCSPWAIRVAVGVSASATVSMTGVGAAMATVMDVGDNERSFNDNNCGRRLEASDKRLDVTDNGTNTLESFNNMKTSSTTTSLHMLLSVGGCSFSKEIPNLKLDEISFLTCYALIVTELSKHAQALQYLLLLAGDVESNPGPINPNSKAELGDVVTIPNIEKQWKNLGVALGIGGDQLDKIEAKHKKAIRCKREMFKLAVKEEVTWKQIILGLSNIGMKHAINEVCNMFDIPQEGLLSTAKSSMEPVEPDTGIPPLSSLKLQQGATPLPSGRSQSVEIETFRSISKLLVAEVSFDPIMLANGVFSRGIITQNDLHQLRMVTSNVSKVTKLIKLIEATILQYPFKFDAFVDALRSISAHTKLADRIGMIHRFNVVSHKMKKLSVEEMNLNYLSAELNNLTLISDDTRIRAARAANSTDMCSVLLSELQTKALGDQFLNLLSSFQNTKVVSDRLKPTFRSDTGSRHDITHQSLDSQKKIEALSKHHTSMKPRTAETHFSSINSPTTVSTDLVVAKGGQSGSNSSSSAMTKVVEPVMQDVKSTDSNSDAYLSAEGNSREFPMQRLDSAYLPKADSELVGKGTGTLGPVTKKFTSDSQGYTDPVLSKPKPMSLADSTVVKPKITKQEVDNFFSVLMKWDAAQVETHLKKNSTMVDYEYKGKRTPLMLAAVEGSKEVVKVLLRYSPSLTAVDSEGYNPLFLAATNGNYEVVKLLVEQPNPQINVKNYRGVPLLVEPARKGFSMITDLLIQHGAKVNEETAEGETPLYMACRKGHLDVVKVLLANNADVSKECKKTQLTPLDEAAQGDNTEIHRLLMKAVTSVKIKSRELFTCKTPDDIKSLIGKGAKIDTRNNEEATPLIVHTKLNHVQVVKELIDLRANVDLQDARGYSALIYAAKDGSYEIVQILVAHGAILDLKQKEHGFTALMFAITHKHPHIVKELVLAKANVAIRNRDNKSSLDLARESGHPEILEVMELTPTLSSGKDPFLNILSSYMAEKTKEKKKESPRTSKKPSPASKAVVAVTHPLVPEENTAHIAEVKKYQRRIADLETRIHDLTIMGAMEIADDNDLTYMERSRLESEFKKLKESKKKAEQYSIEAKQTAQRLSAENFKLREDLSKERHMNELSRKSMMREVEMNVERQAVQSKMEAIRKEVFDQEVAIKAFDLAQQKSGNGKVYKRVHFDAKKLKHIFLKEEVEINLLHLIVSGGLKNSGKSSIVKSMFSPKSMKLTDNLCLYEGIIQQISGSDKDGKWVEGTKLQSIVHTLALAFVQHGRKENELPILDSKQPKAQIFDDPEVQEYFDQTYYSLQKFLANIENEAQIESMLTGTMSAINVFDFGRNRAVYEFVKAIGGRNERLLKLNVFNLAENGKDEIVKPRSDLVKLRGINVLHHLVSHIQSASHSKHTCVAVVGTHADKIPPESLQERCEEVMTLIKHYCDYMSIPFHVYLHKMITVNATTPEGCESLKKAILHLLDVNKEKFSIHIPVRFLFLRYVLHSTSKVFMSRKELASYASKSGCNDRDDIDSFLKIFRECGSIISSSDSGDFLYEYVILLPVDFFRDLNKLYTIMDDKVLPTDLKRPTEFGIVHEEVVRSLWQGSVSSSISNHDFFISVLKNVRLAIKVDDKYFVPSIRTETDTAPASRNSLVITVASNVSLSPFSGVQYMFVKYLTSHYKDEVRVDEKCPYYNVVNFIYKSKKHSEEATIAVRFFTDSTDVSFQPTSAKNLSKGFTSHLYSMLKTDCVAIMNEICSRRMEIHCQDLRYRLAVVCPADRRHYIPFEILDNSVETLICPHCTEGSTTVMEGDVEMNWVRAAYQGTRRSALEKDDIIDPKNLVEICEQLSSLSLENIEALYFKLNPKAEKFKNPFTFTDEILFDVLYKWHRRHTEATKKKLAGILMECDLNKQAFTLDPTLLTKGASKLSDTTSISSMEIAKDTDFTAKEITYIAESWTQSREELADLLSTAAKPECSDILNDWRKKQVGDKRGRLAELFEDNGYPTMSSMIYDMSIS